jgi:ABC-2 type transport system ATP-binding protein
MTAAIEAKDLRKTYPPGVVALDRLSLSVEEGTIFALLGPNGAGKSTTVRVLGTLTRPDGGTARVAGIDVLADPVRVRRAIGVVGQKHGSDREATGRENLVLQGEFYGITGRELRRRVAASLERFGLTDAAGRKVKTYSGGMQRRLDIAMGLLHEPRVLFLDEPTTGLDPEARAELWREIERLSAEQRMTILLSTHYMEEADRLAARLAIVDRGRIVVEGTPSGLKSGLEGDTIHVELADLNGAGAEAALERVWEVEDVRLEGRTLHAHARDGGAAVPAVLAALEARGVRATSVTMARPSLDEVYLRYAGRAYSAASGRPEALDRASTEPEEVAA